MEVSFNDVLIYLSNEGRLLVVAWLAVLGAILGSFMNVVVYRLPRQLSLSHPGSRCPACEHPIRWYDNVPVFGWLKLRGRCRDCKAPISVRYPVVEAAVAAVSALIAWHEAVPEIAQPSIETGAMFELHLGLYAFHFLLICTLICAALMELDGQLIPARMWGSVLTVGLIAPVFQPDLRPVGSVLLASSAGNAIPAVRGILEGFGGFMSALLIGIVPWITWVSTARQSKLAYATGAAALLLLVGTFLGDRAVIAIAVASMALYFATRLLALKWPPLGRFGWAGPLLLVTLIWILSWPDTFALAPGIALEHDLIRAIAAGLIVAVLAIILQFVPLGDQPPKKT